MVYIHIESNLFMCIFFFFMFILVLGGKYMTQKELLYFEDAIGHEGNIICIVEDIIEQLEDDNLISFMKNELEVHSSMKEKLIRLLEEKTHE